MGAGASDANPNIPYGWCDFGDVYRHWVRSLPDGAVVVEVGSYLGQSAITWGHLARRRQRPLRLICIDPFHGIDERYIRTPEFLAEQRRVLLAGGGSMRAGFDANIRAYGLQDWIDARTATSVDAAATFADASVDRVMLDGDHECDSVTSDIEAWWPKVKPGGELVGHDDDWPSVAVAVRVWAHAHHVPVYPVSKRCWRIVKPGGPGTGWTAPEAVRTLLIAICSNERTIGRDTVESLLGLLSASEVLAGLKAHGFASYDVRWYSAHPGVDTLREIAALDALKGLFSHLLFLDADMGWPKDLLARLLAHHDAGIVSGLYHLKRWPHQPVCFNSRTWNATTQVWDYDYDNDASLCGPELRPEELIGLGCALIPRRVFEVCDRPWFAYQRNAQTGLATVTEDVWFCQQARAAGVPVFVDPTISCQHFGIHGVTEIDRYRAEFDLAHIKAGTQPALPVEVAS